MKGLLLPASASTIALTAGPSMAASYVVAILMTPSALRAPAATLLGSLKSPRTASMPAERSRAAEASLRASPVI